MTETKIYTAKWFWNHNKIKPYIGQGETEFELHVASYPWSTPPLAAGLDPTIHYNVQPLIAAPWTEDQLWAWQWTSKWPHKLLIAQSYGLDANILWNGHEPFLDVSRHQGAINGQAIVDAGFKGVVARCTIGWSYLDPFYINNYKIAKDHGLWFGAYHVVWPINRDPYREIDWFLSNVLPQGENELPKVALIDSELGHSYHKAGHHLVSGNEIVEMTIQEAQLVKDEIGEPEPPQPPPPAEPIPVQISFPAGKVELNIEEV